MHTDWTSDPRVAPLLDRLTKRPPAVARYWDYSNSINGMKEYTCYSGARFRELCAIRSEYGEAIYAADDYNHDAATAWLDSPSAESLLDARFSERLAA